MIIKLFKRTILKLSLITVSVLLLTIPFIWLQLSHPQQFNTITQIVAQSSTLLTVFRWIVIVLFVGGWPYFIHYAAKKHVWHSEKTQFWLAKRLHVGVWLIIFELLVCENIGLKFIKLF